MPGRLPHTVDLATLDPEKVKMEFTERMNNMLDTLESMPVEAYQRALKEMHVIVEAGYAIDPSKPSNILMDAENRVFGWIDLIEVDSRENGVTPFYLQQMITHGANYHERVKRDYLSEEEQQVLTERENEVYRDVTRKIIMAVERTPSPYWNHKFSDIDFERFGFTPEEQASLSRLMNAIAAGQAQAANPAAEI